MALRLLAVTLGVVVGTLSALAGTPPPGFSDVAVASGLDQPTGIAFLPDGRRLVTEKTGTIKLFTGGTPTTVGSIPVCTASEMGLLGIAVDPDFASNGFLYLYRTSPENGCGSATNRFNQVVRVTMTGSTIASGSLTVLLSGIRTDNGNHDGGGLRIGPDQKLYVGVGDTGLGDNQGGPGSSTNPYAQDINALNGKLLRLELDGTPAAGNPFIGLPSHREEIYAYGLRNPFRFGFDPVGGSLWLADVGDLTVEEIDVMAAGGNYAWPHCEATLPLGCEQPGDIDPIFTYPHSGPTTLGTSIIGGAFASDLFGALANDYFFADFISGNIYHAVPNPGRNGITGAPDTFVTAAGGPVDVVFQPGGALYYVAIFSGEVRRVAPDPLAPTNVNHVMCYKAALAKGQPRFPSGVTRSLDDAFGGPQTFTLRKTVTLCNPANQDGSPVPDPTAHQEGYTVKALPGTKFVASTHESVDQFASRALQLTRVDSLLVPSNKVPGAGGAPPYAGTAVDHYKCYKAGLAKGSPKFVPPASPTVTDQFFPSGQTFEVQKVTKLCTPVAADGSPINHSASHLVCYQVKLPSGVKFTPQTVSTNNAVRPDVLVAKKPAELCLPAALDP